MSLSWNQYNGGGTPSTNIPSTRNGIPSTNHYHGSTSFQETFEIFNKTCNEGIPIDSDFEYAIHQTISGANLALSLSEIIEKYESDDLSAGCKLFESFASKGMDRNTRMRTTSPYVNSDQIEPSSYFYRVSVPEVQNTLPNTMRYDGSKKILEPMNTNKRRHFEINYGLLDETESFLSVIDAKFIPFYRQHPNDDKNGLNQSNFDRNEFWKPKSKRIKMDITNEETLRACKCESCACSI